MFNNYPDLLTVKTLSELLGTCETTVYQLLRDKSIYSIRIGKTYKIPKSCVIEYIFKNQQ